ncbi:MAG: DUF3467 domain-containing protein [Deltaproteobacteria bacterium]|nr:DUF3467 domain-containing protein [Deltaproteobacteria bacterium]MBW1817212.1 DUF3467 domain-containing protein [Deltaproteobacteria bacterium]MBW2283983.1 DUF3467 domain-containing protein [Deltaproteobacteria bacterium]
MGDEPKGLKVEFPKEMRTGLYSNNMVVAHTREEFILDFIMMAPPSGTVVSRIVMSPGHIKRVIHALQENLAKYEAKFGAIPTPETPTPELTLQ